VTSSPVLFAGPTLSRLQRFSAPDLGGLEVRAPVRRGDIESLCRSRREPGVAIIVDGVFHLGQLSVGHHEIRRALEGGWSVWGLSSMGAIRAAEMASLGMRGFGRVFARYRDDPHFRDDEVTLLHEPVAPYRELSEPLVHQREALSHLSARGDLSPAAEAAILSGLMDRWFGERTLHLLRDRLVEAGIGAGAADALVGSFDRFRRKSLDLEDFLRERPFEAGA
jgi:hypothetical protein